MHVRTKFILVLCWRSINILDVILFSIMQPVCGFLIDSWNLVFNGLDAKIFKGKVPLYILFMHSLCLTVGSMKIMEIGIRG